MGRAVWNGYGVGWNVVGSVPLDGMYSRIRGGIPSFPTMAQVNAIRATIPKSNPPDAISASMATELKEAEGHMAFYVAANSVKHSSWRSRFDMDAVIKARCPGVLGNREKDISKPRTYYEHLKAGVDMAMALTMRDLFGT